MREEVLKFGLLQHFADILTLIMYEFDLSAFISVFSTLNTESLEGRGIVLLSCYPPSIVLDTNE